MYRGFCKKPGCTNYVSANFDYAYCSAACWDQHCGACQRLIPYRKYNADGIQFCSLPCLNTVKPRYCKRIDCVKMVNVDSFGHYYCSAKCWDQKCGHCGNLVIQRRYSVDNVRYCSLSCLNTTSQPKICKRAECINKVNVRTYGQYCSNLCYRLQNPHLQYPPPPPSFKKSTPSRAPIDPNKPKDCRNPSCLNTVSVTTFGDGRYCSAACWDQRCGHCQKVITSHNFSSGGVHFCTLACLNMVKPKICKKENCTKIVHKRTFGNGQYCSADCLNRRCATCSKSISTSEYPSAVTTGSFYCTLNCLNKLEPRLCKKEDCNNMVMTTGFGRGTYCSANCWGQKCGNCQNIVPNRIHASGGTYYCSMSCLITKVPRICKKAGCNNIISIPSYGKGKFCSKECVEKAPAKKRKRDGEDEVGVGVVGPYQTESTLNDYMSIPHQNIFQ